MTTLLTHTLPPLTQVAARAPSAPGGGIAAPVVPPAGPPEDPAALAAWKDGHHGISSIKIVGARTRSDERRRKYTMFVCEVSCGEGFEWRVERRYREFHALNKVRVCVCVWGVPAHVTSRHTRPTTDAAEALRLVEGVQISTQEAVSVSCQGANGDVTCHPSFTVYRHVLSLSLSLSLYRPS
jgi:hypothetical protein